MALPAALRVSQPLTYCRKRSVRIGRLVRFGAMERSHGGPLDQKRHAGRLEDVSPGIVIGLSFQGSIYLSENLSRITNTPFGCETHMIRSAGAANDSVEAVANSSIDNIEPLASETFSPEELDRSECNLTREVGKLDNLNYIIFTREMDQ